MEDTTLSLSAENAWLAFNNGKFEKQSSSSFNPGFTTSYYWLVAETDSSATEAMFLEIGSAQINEILFYEVVNNQPVPRYTTGDHLPFSSRPIPSVNFTFPLEKTSRHYLIRINKHNESLQLTYRTRPALKFFEESTELNMTLGIMTGAIVLMLIFGVFLFAITKELVYLFYILYIAAGWMYVWANQG
ncbi:MAG TPA: 7TM-DISM domain-containing protein, partial [Chryseosolibacter sp.]